VLGRCGRTPSLDFIGREDRVVDLAGEKLNEAFVDGALNRVLSELSVTPTFAMLAPELSSSSMTAEPRSRYTLFLQSHDTPPRELAARLDDALRANPHYALCRELGQLDRPAIFRIRAYAHQTYLAALSKRAALRLGDIKPTCLNSHDCWSDQFDGEHVKA
jgi:hypothetical protein